MVNQDRNFAAGLRQPPVGSYRVMDGAGNAVGTEEFRAAAGPAGWGYFSTVGTREPEPHREAIDLVFDGASCPVRVRIDTGSDALLLAAWGEASLEPALACRKPVLILRDRRGAASRRPPFLALRRGARPTARGSRLTATGTPTSRWRRRIRRARALYRFSPGRMMPRVEVSESAS